MVVRRIRESAANHNWFGVSVDLLIVVLGVFLGMQANNWNQARLERQEEHSYRSRLVEDLRTNETDLQQRRIYYRQVRDHALSVLRVLDGSAPVGEGFLIDAYQATQIIPRTLTRFTYDEMIAVGGVPRIGNADLREQVKNYYAGIETAETTFHNIPPYREHLRTVMPYEVQRLVRTNCREILSTGPSGEQMNVLPRSCHLRLDPTSLGKAAAEVRASPGLRGNLTRHVIDLDLKLDLFVLIERRARNLRLLLEEQA